jgi:hypothetical protein
MSLFGSSPFGADPGVPPPMPATAFHRPRNNASAAVAAPRAAGAPIAVDDAGPFGSTFPLIATAIRTTVVAGVATYVSLCILEVTGLDPADPSGNTLAVSGAIEGTADVALVAGDTLAMLPTALIVTELQDAHDALEATTVSTTGSYADPPWIASLAGSKVSGLGTAAIHAATDFLPAGDDLAWDAADKLLKVADTSSGRTYIGALPGFPAYGGIWIGHPAPDNTNYSLLGTGTSTFFNDVNELSLNVSNVTLVNLRTACVAVGYGVTSSTADATTTMHVAAAAANYKALVVAGAPGQMADLQEWRVGTGPVLARVNAAGSLKIDGQAGEYPIEVTTADGLTTIFRVTNTTGDVFSGGEYSSGVGFRATAFGAYVGVSAANRLTFPGASPTILANPLSASQSVFGVQGAFGQTEPLVVLLDSAGVVLAQHNADGSWKPPHLADAAAAADSAYYSTTQGELVYKDPGGVPRPLYTAGTPGDASFVFSQATPAATWTIAHGLGKFPSVTVVDSAGSVVVGDVNYADANNLTVGFSGGFSGKAYLN